MHLGPMSKLQEVHEGKEGLFKFKSDCHLDKARTVTRSKGVPGPLLKCRAKAFLFLCTNQQNILPCNERDEFTFWALCLKQLSILLQKEAVLSCNLLVFVYCEGNTQMQDKKRKTSNAQPFWDWETGDWETGTSTQVDVHTDTTTKSKGEGLDYLSIWGNQGSGNSWRNETQVWVIKTITKERKIQSQAQKRSTKVKQETTQKMTTKCTRQMNKMILNCI